MEKAVLLKGNNDGQVALDSGLVWSMKFKTATGRYVYAIDITYSPQCVAPTRFSSSKITHSIIGTQVLVQSNEIDGVLFAVRVAMDPDANYRECPTCCFLQQYHCVEISEYRAIFAKLEALEKSNQVLLTRYLETDEELKQSYDEGILSIHCLDCFAEFWCRTSGEREEQGIHFQQTRHSFVED